ncbi:NAD-dependent protein deacetylase sirtuin-3 [Scleropages formosus]|uniref:Si:dkey-103i16.6 n=1 Tax=Scleropages formosus TaxID=113540 RepID=A0A8C9UXE5_SCLFO|nr:NAD-dependent protein deacetylase sirtuin-3-like [Scleropages formosus]XP_018610440.2 NAD-dependent protein deacetylase sirtuin-3-like [Scleropages formosus]
MSKARLSRDRRASQAALSRVTRSTSSQVKQGSPTTPQVVLKGLQGPSGSGIQWGRPSDSALAEDLSLMSVSGQWEDTTSRKGRFSKTGSSATQRGPSGSKALCTAAPQGTLNAIARLMKLGRCRNVVVVAGAGISTASGIPDFRTPGTGLYANLQKYNVPFPEAVFDIDFFSNDPRPFFSLAKELYPGCHKPNYIHYFIRMLHLKGLLLRMYTQNIDGLEKMCGIPEEKLVEAHGSFKSASCHLCYTPFSAHEAKQAIMNDKVPICTICEGTVKPDVVFFGEDLPQSYFQHCTDFPKTDLLIIMGTSLQIEPFASLVDTVRSTVPRLLLNRHPVGPFLRVPLRRSDYMELGDLEDSVRRLAEILGWHQDICDLIQDHEQKVHAAFSGRGGYLPQADKDIALQTREQSSDDDSCNSETPSY